MPADYDGDGRADIALYVPSPNAVDPSQWFILGSRDGAGQQIPFGGIGHEAVPADYDGDGRADLATYVPSPNPTDPVACGSSQNVGATPFGGAGHIPVPRDYDGDGRADIATFAGGQWFVLNSGTGAGVLTPFGTPADVPVPAPLLPYRLPGFTARRGRRPGAVTAAAAPAAARAVAAAAAGRPSPRPGAGGRAADDRLLAPAGAGPGPAAGDPGPGRRGGGPPGGPPPRRPAPQDDLVAAALDRTGPAPGPPARRPPPRVIAGAARGRGLSAERPGPGAPQSGSSFLHPSPPRSEGRRATGRMSPGGVRVPALVGRVSLPSGSPSPWLMHVPPGAPASCPGPPRGLAPGRG